MGKLVNELVKVAETLNQLSEGEFMTVMCMCFDEYSRVHKESNAVDMATTVADFVKKVNEALGAYV